MTEDAPCLPDLSAVAGKPVLVAFDGGRMSDGSKLSAELFRRLVPTAVFRGSRRRCPGGSASALSMLIEICSEMLTKIPKPEVRGSGSSRGHYAPTGPGAWTTRRVARTSTAATSAEVGFEFGSGHGAADEGPRTDHLRIYVIRGQIGYVQRVQCPRSPATHRRTPLLVEISWTSTTPPDRPYCSVAFASVGPR